MSNNTVLTWSRYALDADNTTFDDLYRATWLHSKTENCGHHDDSVLGDRCKKANGAIVFLRGRGWNDRGFAGRDQSAKQAFSKGSPTIRILVCPRPSRSI